MNTSTGSAIQQWADGFKLKVQQARIACWIARATLASTYNGYALVNGEVYTAYVRKEITLEQLREFYDATDLHLLWLNQNDPAQVSFSRMVLIDAEAIRKRGNGRDGLD